MSQYADTLESVKHYYPFMRWQESGLDRYTPTACGAFRQIFDDLISQLAALGSDVTESAKLAAFKEAIQATNRLHSKDESLIETGEREDLCELTNRIALAAGMDPKKYGGGEGPASEWRDW